MTDELVEDPPDDDLPVEPAAPVPEAAAVGEIVVTAAVKVNGLNAGVPTVVADSDEWRALAANGLVSIG